jgi:hypothetical protein
MPTAAYYRLRAAECLELANQARDEDVAARLRERAGEYRELAAALEPFGQNRLLNRASRLPASSNWLYRLRRFGSIPVKPAFDGPFDDPISDAEAIIKLPRLIFVRRSHLWQFHHGTHSLGGHMGRLLVRICNQKIDDMPAIADEHHVLDVGIAEISPRAV